jgi:hypothetical protein
MKLAYPFNVVRTSSLPRRLSIACAAAFADKEDLRRAIMLAAAYEIIERLLA